MAGLRRSWNLFVLWVHDQCMQVFNGKNTNRISKSFWYTLEFGYELVHCLKFNRRQGFKGAEFLKSPKNLIFRQIYLQDKPRCGNLSKTSECFVYWFLRECFSQRGELNLLVCLQQLLGTAMTRALCYLRSCQSSVSWDACLSFWILASPEFGPPGDGSQHDPEGFPTSSSEGRVFPLKLDQFYMMTQNASQTYNFVIIISGWDSRNLTCGVCCLVQLDERPDCCWPPPQLISWLRAEERSFCLKAGGILGVVTWHS